MKNLNSVSKIFLFLSVISGILWIGTYTMRLVLAYQIFEGINFTLRQYINTQNLNGIFIILNSAILTTDIIYFSFIIFSILFILTSKLSLKLNGWLFIIILIIIITLPLESYLISIDYKIYFLVKQYSIFNNSEVLNLYIKRLKIFSSFPMIEILSYISIIYFAIFRPLTSNIVKNEN